MGRAKRRKNSGPVPSSTFNDRCDHAGVRRSRWKHFSVRTHAGLDTSPLNERVYLGSAKSRRKKKGTTARESTFGLLELHRFVMNFIFKNHCFDAFLLDAIMIFFFIHVFIYFLNGAHIYPQRSQSSFLYLSVRPCVV